jgi:hypothetical protein
MPTVLISASQRVLTEGDMLSVAQIERAFRDASDALRADPAFRNPPTRSASEVPALGAWIGPQPRVVRAKLPGTLALPPMWAILAFGALSPIVAAQIETQAAWLYQLPDDVPWSVARKDAIVGTLLARLDALLQAGSGSWSAAQMHPYAPALHGSLAWWSSGAAARTATREEPLGLISRITNTPESPVGQGRELSSTAETGVAFLERVADAIVPIAIVGGAIAATVYFWPVIAGARPGKKNR